MRIVHVIHTPRLSGAEVLVALLAEAHVAHGHTVLVLSLAPSQSSFCKMEQKLKGKGVTLHFPRTELNAWSRFAFFLAALKNEKDSIVFAHSVIPSAYARAAAFFLKIKVASVLHDASRDDYSQWKLRFAEHILPDPRMVIAVSAEALKNYAARFNLNASRGIVIENAFDSVAINTALKKRDLKRSELLGMHSTRTVVVSVGRFSKQKNQLFLLDAFNELDADTRGKCILLMVGITEDLDYEVALEQAVRAQKSAVLLLKNRTDSLEIMACGDVFCMPSLNEGFSLAFLEGLALGVPIVASTIPAFSFARLYDGVILTSNSNRSEFSSALKIAIDSAGQHFPRSLDSFMPKTVATLYENIANKMRTSEKLL